MELKQDTIGDIIEDEKQMILHGEELYGELFVNAFEFNNLLNNFVRSIRIKGWVFTIFLSQVRKYHTLALFSTVRRHHIQAQMDLRQAIEAGANAAYAIANPQKEKFVVSLPNGTLNAPSSLTKKRYKWLEDNFRVKSDFLVNQKRKINKSVAHQNMIYGFLNFNFDEISKKKFNTPFFDKEDKYLIKTNLWFIGNLALGLMDLFYGVNQRNNIITFIDDFTLRLGTLEKENHRLKAIMMEHPRYKKSMARR